MDDAAYRRYAPALLRKCERVLQSRDDAEDVVHALFVDLLQKGRGDLDLRYLYRAATNRCLNVLKARANRARLLARHDEALRGTVRVRCDDQVIGMDLLVKLVRRLDRRGREVLVLRFFDELPQEEIAALLDTSRKTVGQRLQRIRALVAELSDPARPGPAPPGAPERAVSTGGER